MVQEKKSRPLPTSATCFLCGEENPYGLKIRFHQDGDTVYTEYRVDERRTGFDGLAHGGVLAALLDETMGWAAALAFGRMCITAEITIRYLKVVEVGTKVVVTAKPASRSRRLCVVEGEVRDQDGTVYTRASAKFLPLSVEETRRIDSQLIYPEGGTSVFNLPEETADVT
jgi:uncharacterized protein (TIGR00369 family)